MIYKDGHSMSAVLVVITSQDCLITGECVIDTVTAEEIAPLDPIFAQT